MISWVAVCGGVVIGLWITVSVVLLEHKWEQAKPKSQHPVLFEQDTRNRTFFNVPGAPQHLLRTSLHNSNALGAETLGSKNRPKNTFTLVEQRVATAALVQRVVGLEVAGLFEVHVTGKAKNDDPDTFEIRDIESPKSKHAAPRILLKGTTGVAVASALNWYLRYHCKVDTSWMSSFPLQMPKELPAVGKAVEKTSLVRWGYYENVCTHSYTQVIMRMSAPIATLLVIMPSHNKACLLIITRHGGIGHDGSAKSIGWR